MIAFEFHQTLVPIVPELLVFFLLIPLCQWMQGGWVGFFLSAGNSFIFNSNKQFIDAVLDWRFESFRSPF